MSSITNTRSSQFLLAILILAPIPGLAGPALTLIPGAAQPGATVTLPLALDPAGNPIAGLQWTLQFPPSQVAAVSVTVGAAATTARKTISCTGGVGFSTCLLTGLNTDLLSAGVVANVSFTLAASPGASIALQVVNTLAVAPNGFNVGITGAGSGIVISAPPIPPISSLQCTPATLNPGSTAVCTLTLAGPAPSGGATYSVSSDNPAVSVPASVTVAAGSSSTAFPAPSATTASPATVTIRAFSAGSSATAFIAVVAPSTDPAGLFFSPSSIVFSTSGSLSQVLHISCTTNGLAFTASPSAAWIALGSTTGLVNSDITITAIPANLPVGTYHATIAFTTSGAAAYQGTVTVTLSVESSTTAPVATLNAVMNAASNTSGPLAPGEMVVLFGTGLGPATLTNLLIDPSSGLVSSSVANTQVLFNGIPGPIVYASSTQVAAIVPYQLAGRNLVSVHVKNLTSTSNTITWPVTTTAPGIFTADASGSGAGAIVNEDGSINGPDHPAAAGSVVVMYATGEGQTAPGGVDGQITNGPNYPMPLLPVSTLIDGQPADILFAGEAPGVVAGIMQLNVRIPAAARSGNVPVVLTVGPNSSQAGVTVAVR